nr:hypothetical protein [Nitrospirota bacterium]
MTKTGPDWGVPAWVLKVQFALGAASFFCFFSAMFNGLTDLMYLAAGIGLTVNLAVSLLVGRKNLKGGAIAAVAFAGPALAFALFSLGDFFAYGKAAPFLFWSSAAFVTAASGLMGMGVAYGIKIASKGA